MGLLVIIVMQIHTDKTYGLQGFETNTLLFYKNVPAQNLGLNNLFING